MGVFTLGEATRLALAGAARAETGSNAKRLRTPRTSERMLDRAHAPVRRGSIEAGTFEDTFFAVPAKGETDRLLHVARRTLDAARRLRRDARAGARTLSATERGIAALTAAAVRVYEEILTLARLNRGRVFPTYDHLAHATGLGRATVARALAILEAIGFLVRQRRFKRVADAIGNARYAQTSNVYRAALPQAVLAYLPRWLRPAPLPCDDAQRRADETSGREAMLKTLTCRELAEATVEGPIGRMLARLGSALDRRCESHEDTQSLTSLLCPTKQKRECPRARSIDLS